MITEANGNVLTVKFKGIKKGWEQWVQLRSDAHHDNIHCNRTIEKDHLKEAKERNALIISGGDDFCAMQGKYDPRASMDDIRPEDVGADYLDRIVRHAAEDYAPYAKNWLLFGKGNHERQVLKRHHTCLISSLVHRLNSDHGGKIHIGGVGGWVRFMFEMRKTVCTSKRMKYHHGAGGGGPVTRGTIQSNRQAVYLPDADIVMNGHTHDAWYLPIARERLNIAGKVTRDLIHFVRTPGYKDSYGKEGWEDDKWHPPKPIGCIWLRFFYKPTDGIMMEFTPAVT